MSMRRTITCLLLALCVPAGSACAKAPVFSGTCPGVSVQTTAKGKATINGRRASIKTINANAWDVKGAGYIVSVSRDAPDAKLNAVYTGPHRANGVCQIVEDVAAATAAPPPAAAHPSAGMPSQNAQACLRAVTQQTNNGDVVLLSSETSEANDTVIVGVGRQRAKWKCLAKDGKVAEVSSMTNEGAL